MADRAILLQLLESYHVATLPILKVREIIKMGRTGDLMTREYWSLAANEFKFATKTQEPDVERATLIQDKHREEISKRLLCMTQSFLLADGLLEEFREGIPVKIRDAAASEHEGGLEDFQLKRQKLVRFSAHEQQ